MSVKEGVKIPAAGIVLEYEIHWGPNTTAERKKEPCVLGEEGTRRR